MKGAFETLKYWEKDVEYSDKLNLTKQANYVTDIWTSPDCLKEFETCMQHNGGYDEDGEINKA